MVHHRRNAWTANAAELKAIAIERSCYGMWVITEPGNDAALATYRSIDGVDEAGSVTFTMVLNDDPTNPTAAN